MGKSKDKEYYNAQKKYWNSKRDPNADYSALYEDFHNRTSGGTKFNKDPNLATWESTMSKDEGYKNWLANKNSVTTTPASTTQPISNDARVIIMKDENGNDRKVGISSNPEDTKNYLSGVSRANTPESLANASVGDYWIDSNDNLHVVTQGDIDISKRQLAGKSFDTFKELSDYFDGDKDQIVDWLKTHPAYELGDVTKASLGDEAVSEIEAARAANSPSSDSTGAEAAKSDDNNTDGLNAIQNRVNEIDSKKAGYHDIPTEFKDDRDNLQYRTIYSDYLDYQDTKNYEEEARSKDKVRSEALTYKEQLEEIVNKGNDIINEKEKLEKALKKANSKLDANIIKNTIKQYESSLSDLSKEWERLTNIPMSKIDDDDYLLTVGVDPARIEELASDAGIDLNGFLGNVKETQDKISYLKNDIKDDINFLMEGKGTPEEMQAAAERVDQVLPELRKHIDNDVELAKGSLPSLRKVAENIGDPDIIEMVDNVEGMTHLFEDQNKMLLNPENLDKVMGAVDQLDDIVKHQDNYNANTRYARDARLSAFNKLIFNIFDRIKSDFIFMAAAESGNPQMIRSALDQFNYNLEMAENKRQTDKFGAYTDNRIREISQDNLAKFKQITEIEPALKQLEGEINLESRKGRMQMQSIINAWDEYQKQMSKIPAEQKVSFATWVSQNNGSGGIANQVVMALLSNFPQLADGLKNLGVPLPESEPKPTGGSSTEKFKEDIQDVSSGKKKTSTWLDNATSKLSQKKEPEKEEDPDLVIDMQNTVNSALNARSMPPQAAPQAGTPQTNSGFGRTNLA